MNPLSEHPFGSGGLRVRRYRLENGLDVLLLPDPSAPVLAYQTWFRVGSRHEREGKTGIAHLFEHLMFNETETLAAGEFDRLMEARGGRTNAATWVDWTCYQDDVPASELELAVRLEAERMRRLVVRTHQVESEREVVMNERRYAVEDDIDGFLSEQLFKAAFTRHPYRAPTIGWMADIAALTVEDAMEFYHRYYAPNNATLVVVGDFDEGVALRLIEAAYGAIGRQDIPPEVPSEEPPQTEERRLAFVKPVATEKLLIGYKAPGFLHEDHLPLQVLSDILLGGASSRLYRRLRIERELAGSIGGSVTPFRDPGLWEVSVSVRRGHSAEEVLQVIDEELGRLRDEGVREDEVERSKARFLTHFYATQRTAHGKASELGEYHTTGEDYRLMFAVPDELSRLRADDLMRAAERYVRSELRTVIVALPGEEAAGAEDGADEEPVLPGPVRKGE